MAKKYEMPRGDERTMNVKLPTANYAPGTVINFGIRPRPNDSSDDSDITLKIDLTDDDITGTDGAYTVYLLTIPKELTNEIELGIKRKKFTAEIQVTSPTGAPSTFPTFDFYITQDINRETGVRA